MQFNRRDFLKLARVLPASIAMSSVIRSLGILQPLEANQKNVIIVVLDALSARNVSLYGYPRETMPNLTRLSKRAIVYRNYYAGSNFTTSGTATLLTGVLPWTHRAIRLHDKVSDPFVTRNIFGAFQNHYRIAYTHNSWAYTLLRQFQNEIDELIPKEKLLLSSYNAIIPQLLQNDDDIATVSWIRGMNINNDGYSYSLLLSHLYEKLQDLKIERFKPVFPRGLPTAVTGSDQYFTLEEAVNWITNQLNTIRQPFLGYFHFLPPHAPYRTTIEFYNAFEGDHYRPVKKPLDIFAKKNIRDEELERREYDEFLLYCDQEFGRFYQALEESGLLENTWLILTSDHGEMFERGIVGHSTDAMYEPVVRVPLLIFEPGRETGMEINTPTSAIDILPTLLHVTGQTIPDWVEGSILPPYAPTDYDPGKRVYVVRATKNPKQEPLKHVSIALVKGRYKLHYYLGYPEVEREGLVKLFDIEADPEEMVDLYLSQKNTANELLDELKTKLAQVNQPYL